MSEIEKAINCLSTFIKTLEHYEAQEEETKAMKIAVQALQEKLERENGCACCNNHVPVKDFAKEYSIEVDDVEVSLWEDLKCLATIKINYCPMCGRRLEHIGEATNMVEGE